MRNAIVLAVLGAAVSSAPRAPMARAAEAAEAGPAGGRFRAACVKVDITPEAPQWLHGYGPRKSEGVRDRIHHRIAALDDGTTDFYLVSTEICTVSPAFYRAFSKKLEERLGIGPDRIWWSTTHTHSAPHVGPQDPAPLFAEALGDRFSIDEDVAYRERVIELLLDGIEKARARLEPARLGIGVGTAEANVNRRERNREGRIVLGVNPEGPVDRQVGVVRLERPDGSPIGLIANYAIHGTALGPGNLRISGDVPGIVAAYVERRIGAPMLFVNGAEGDAAPLRSVGAEIDHPALKEYEVLLGDRILEANASIAKTSGDVALHLAKTAIETPRKRGLGWPEALAEYASVSADGVPCVRVPVYTLAIGRDAVIWAAPLELFGEIAIRIRAASPFPRTFYFGLTNGSLIYLPTKAAFAEGGYETGVTPFTDRAEADFEAGVVRHLRELARGWSSSGR